MRYVSIDIAAGRLGKSASQTRRMCIAGQLPGAMKRKRAWEIPVSADARFVETECREVGSECPDFDGVSLDKRDEALRKKGIVARCADFVAGHVRNGGEAEDALAAFLVEAGVSRTTYFRWKRTLRGDGVGGLVDRRGRKRSSESAISEGAFDEFKSLYLVLQRPSLRMCWRMVRCTNESEDKGWTIPDYRRMCEYVKDHIPYPSLVLLREGTLAYNAKCSPHVLIDPDSVEPGDCWVGDHHELNVMIRHRGRWVRPWITAWQDMRSRMIVGWHFSVQPNQTTVMRAMGCGVVEYGPPRWVKIDNGKDYDSHMWTGQTKASRKSRKKLGAGYLDERMCGGLYDMMDVRVSFAIPYNARAKRIERFFDTMDRQFCKVLPTYCGKDVRRKPDDLNAYLKSDEAIEKAYDIESIAEVAGRYIDAYNNAAHTGAGMDGQTPAQVMATRTSRAVLQEGVVELLMRVWTREVTLGRNGVKVRGMWYGQYDQQLLMLQGKKVRASYDPDDMRCVYVYEAATLTFITVAEQSCLMQYGAAVAEDDLREAMRQQRHARRVAKEFRPAQRVANMALPDLAIKALCDGEDALRQDAPVRQAVGSVRAVRTPLDGQVKAHKRVVTQRMLKKAVGAESKTRELDMDYSLLNRPKNKHGGVKLEFQWGKHE